MVLLKNIRLIKGFGDVNRLLDSKKYFDMQKKKLIGTVFLYLGKNRFETGIIIPSKLEIVKIVQIVFCLKILN